MQVEAIPIHQILNKQYLRETCKYFIFLFDSHSFYHGGLYVGYFQAGGFLNICIYTPFKVRSKRNLVTFKKPQFLQLGLITGCVVIRLFLVSLFDTT